jgi:hypothetical protein
MDRGLQALIGDPRRPRHFFAIRKEQKQTGYKNEEEPKTPYREKEILD